MRIRVSITTPAPPDVAWRELSDVAAHVEWMKDAETLEFAGPQRSGVGTAFACRTRVGPFRLVDHMVVTEWDEPHAMAVRHTGLVTGEGRFVLAPTGGGTEIVWNETLTFPARLGGRAAAWLARPVLRAIWRGNLRRLSARIAARHH